MTKIITPWKEETSPFFRMMDELAVRNGVAKHRTAFDIIGGMIRRMRTPEQWLKGDFAYDAHANAIDPRKPGAVRFCVEGAFCAEVNLLYTMHRNMLIYYPAVRRCLIDAAGALWGASTPKYGHVLAVSDRGHAWAFTLLVVARETARRDGV